VVKRTRKHGAFAIEESFDIDFKRVEDRRDLNGKDRTIRRE